MEFLEDGGVLTLLDIVNHSQSKEDDKAEALRLLLSVSQAGRKYKEIICESHGKVYKLSVQYSCSCIQTWPRDELPFKIICKRDSHDS